MGHTNDDGMDDYRAMVEDYDTLKAKAELLDEMVKVCDKYIKYKLAVDGQRSGFPWYDNEEEESFNAIGEILSKAKEL